MLRAGDRASALTRQLLAFSRRQVIVPRVMDLNASVEEARKSMKRMLREDIELNVALAPELWKVYVDPVQLEQILINLVVNARDAMPEGGALTIETRNEAWDAAYVKQHPPAKPGNHVVLAIADTGVGMDEATRKRIFEPFFSTKGPGMGAGLGLSTVYGIVKQNQGYIWVRSQPGSGTTFEVCFPATQAEETAPAAKPAAKPHAGGPETILVVEDEEWVRNLILEILRAEGYQTLIARDGMDALEQAAQHAGPIHLLATDVVMPRMNGKELARKLIETRKELKVLFISGYADSVLYHHGVLDPGIQLLQKPFTPDELAAKVREVLKPPDREAQAPA
ncbi:MAG: ATP-binding protein [Planctomycetota bacterium]|nr:ATP-binding protein [Planctomycetota bacterium]